MTTIPVPPARQATRTWTKPTNVPQKSEADVPHLSISQIKRFQTCPLQWQYSRRYTPAFVSSALVFGKGVHEGLRLFYQGRLEGRKVGLEEMLAGYDSTWDEENLPVRYGKKETPESLRTTAAAILTLFLERAQDSEVIAVEERLWLRVSEDLPEVVGYVDLIERLGDGTVRLVDFKTAARKPSESSPPQPEQLLLYGLAAGGAALFEQVPVLQYTYFTKTKTPELIEHVVTPTTGSFTKLLELISRCGRAMERNAAYPCPGWQCAGCGYQDRCATWPREDDA